MKTTILTTLLLSLALGPVQSQKAAYQIYNAKGKKVSYEKMLRTLKKRDIVLFGELHDNPISHWLQWELTNDLHAEVPLILGAEMIEADNQGELDAYLEGRIDYKALDSLARLWKNHKTDYAPLVDFARDNKLPFIATNVPRRYAGQVHKGGGFQTLYGLPPGEKAWIAPLPIPFDPELPGYRNILDMMGEHGTPALVKAQALKDATMAHFILEHFRPGSLFLHFNGAYHSNHYEGIVWYLRQRAPELAYGTLSTVSQENVHKLERENFGLADFILCVDSHMTTTY